MYIVTLRDRDYYSFTYHDYRFKIDSNQNIKCVGHQSSNKVIFLMSMITYHNLASCQLLLLIYQASYAQDVDYKIFCFPLGKDNQSIFCFHSNYQPNLQIQKHLNPKPLYLLNHTNYMILVVFCKSSIYNLFRHYTMSLEFWIFTKS